MTTNQQSIQIKKIEKDLSNALIAIDRAFIVESNTTLSEIKQRKQTTVNDQVVLNEISNFSVTGTYQTRGMNLIPLSPLL